MSKLQKVTRRQLIKDFGMVAFLASPLLRSIAEGAAATTRLRHIHFFKPLGVNKGTFMPKAGFNFTGQVIEPLTPYKADLRFFQNVGLGRRNGDAHALGFLGVFTGVDQRGPSGTSGFDFADGPSLDQVIAKNIAKTETLPFQSLHFGLGFNSNAASVFNRIANLGNKVTLPSDVDAGRIYDKIMGRISLICGGSSGDPAAVQARLAEIRRGHSILDYQLNSINSFKTRYSLAGEEAQKLDATLTKVREVETDLAAEQKLLESGGGGTGKACPVTTRRADVYSSPIVPDISFKVMIDLMMLAFDWDLTRVATFQIGTHSSYQVFPATGVTSTYHPLSHLLKAGDFDRFNMVDKYIFSKIAMLLGGLKAITDPDGKTALYNSTFLLGTELANGDDHSHTNMPFIVAGQGGGHLKGGGTIVNAGGGARNHQDLLLTLANVHGLNMTKFGDAQYNKGVIPGMM